jgi:hypothetical protein
LDDEELIRSLTEAKTEMNKLAAEKFEFDCTGKVAPRTTAAQPDPINWAHTTTIAPPTSLLCNGTRDPLDFCQHRTKAECESIYTGTIGLIVSSNCPVLCDACTTGMSTTAATTPSTVRPFKRTISTSTTITAPTTTHTTTDDANANLRPAAIKPHWQLNHRTLPLVVLGFLVAVVFTVMVGLHKRRRGLQDGDVSSSDIALLELDDDDDVQLGTQPSGGPAVGSFVQLQYHSSGQEAAAVISTETWKSVLNLDVTIAGNPPLPSNIAESSWLGQIPAEMMEIVSNAKIARASHSLGTSVVFPTSALFDGCPSNAPASLVGDGSGNHHYLPSINPQMSVQGNAVHNFVGLANQQVALPPIRQANESISFPNVDDLLGLCSDQDLQHSVFGGGATFDPQTQPVTLDFALPPHCARPIPPTNKLHDALHIPETRVPLLLTQMHLNALEVCENVFMPSRSPPTSTTSGYSSAPTLIRDAISSDDSSHHHSKPPSPESSNQHSSSAVRRNIKAEFTGTDIPFRTPDGSAWSDVVLAMSVKEIKEASKSVSLTTDQFKELKLSARRFKQQIAQRKYATKMKNTRELDKLTRMNDTETPHGPDATLGIGPPIGVGVANGNVADIVPGTIEGITPTTTTTISGGGSGGRSGGSGGGGAGQKSPTTNALLAATEEAMQHVHLLVAGSIHTAGS